MQSVYRINTRALEYKRTDQGYAILSAGEPVAVLEPIIPGDRTHRNPNAVCGDGSWTLEEGRTGVIARERETGHPAARIEPVPDSPREKKILFPNRRPILWSDIPHSPEGWRIRDEHGGRLLIMASPPQDGRGIIRVEELSIINWKELPLLFLIGLYLYARTLAPMPH